VIHQAPGLLDLEASLLDGCLTGHPQSLQQDLRVVFHRFKHFGVGVPPHDVVHLVAAAW